MNDGKNTRETGIDNRDTAGTSQTLDSGSCSGQESARPTANHGASAHRQQPEKPSKTSPHKAPAAIGTSTPHMSQESTQECPHAPTNNQASPKKDKNKSSDAENDAPMPHPLLSSALCPQPDDDAHPHPEQSQQNWGSPDNAQQSPLPSVRSPAQIGAEANSARKTAVQKFGMGASPAQGTTGEYEITESPAKDLESPARNLNSELQACAENSQGSHGSRFQLFAAPKTPRCVNDGEVVSHEGEPCGVNRAP